MSVLASQKHDSKLLVLVNAEKLRDVIVNLKQRNFGVKTKRLHLRSRYIYNDIDTDEQFEKRMFMLVELGKQADQLTLGIIADVRGANSVSYPVTLGEYETRRQYMTEGIVKCEQLKGILQEIARLYDVDINIYRIPIEEINRQKALIAKWRKSDNRIRRRFGASTI